MPSPQQPSPSTPPTRGDTGTSDSPDSPRRAARRALITAGLALPAAGAAAYLLDGRGDHAVLSGTRPATMRTLPVPIGPDGGLAPRLSGSAGPLRFRMLALTWQGSLADVGNTRLMVRTRAAGRWTEWQQVRPLHDGPDPGDVDEAGNGVSGTDPIWVADSDDVEVQVRGRRPAGLSMVLIDPGVRVEDAADGYGTVPPSELMARSSGSGASSGYSPRPKLKYRSDWGADESWRSGSPRFCRTLQQVHVHHTVNSNDYHWTEVPALIRGMYQYHTQSLGWSDIGYNFLVDKFGRIWVGRAGGANKLVRGAHTLGFNDTSTGVSMIGNFEIAQPTDKAITAVVKLASWKLDLFHRNPEGWIPVYSHGSDKYPEGRWVTLRVIDGHRDTNDTACPGRYLYAKLPEIRDRARWRTQNL